MANIFVIKKKISSFNNKIVKVSGDKSLSIRWVLLASLAKGKSLKNMFGMSFKIVKVKNITEQSKTKNEISCVGEALFDNGKSSKLLMKVFKDQDNEIMYEFKQL